MCPALLVNRKACLCGDCGTVGLLPDPDGAGPGAHFHLGPFPCSRLSSLVPFLENCVCKFLLIFYFKTLLYIPPPSTPPLNEW